MKILNLVQGSEEWKNVRLTHFTASEAPIMMGASPYMSRDDLLTYKTTQNEKEVSYWTQKIYDKGHEVEAKARPIAEKMLGEDLYPVTGSERIESMPLLASFDGLTMMEDKCFEHKQWNAEKAAKLNDGEVLPEHYWQIEQQLLVSGAESCMFMISDGTESNMEYAFYHSVPERREALIAGWKQFQKDLENYVPKVYEEMPEAEAIMDLPALSIQLVGQVKESNLAVYQKTAMEFIESINTDLQTDQDFANAEKMVKFCDKTEKELELVKKQALSQTADVDHLFRTIDTLKDSMRAKRLELNKLVTQKKELIRNEIMMRGKQELAEVLEQANIAVKPVSMPPYAADFAGAMKGKKTIKSLNESVNDALAQAKIEIESVKQHILLNLTTYKNLAGSHLFLFNDLQQIIMKDSTDFTLMVESRIDKHERAEEHRREAERARIRAEEEAKAKAEAEAALKAEIAKAESAERIQAAVEKIVDEGVYSEKKPEAASVSSPTREIEIYLEESLGLSEVKAFQVASAIVHGHVPHTAFTGKATKAA